MSVSQISRSWGLLGIAVLIAGVAFWLTTKYLSNKETSLRQQIESEQGDMVAVVVASTDVLPGDTIGGNNMAIAEVPADFLSSNAVTPDEFEYFNGQVVKHSMSPGEPLLNHYVSGLGIERFSDLLDSGQRAVTLEIDSINSVAGMILPGDFVDVMLVMEETLAGNVGDPIKNLKPLLQNIKILAVDTLSLVSKEQEFVAFSEDEQLSYSTVTVGVSFEEAAKLILARDVGDIVFMLRNNEDKETLKSDLLTKHDLLKSGKAGQQYQFYGGSSVSGGAIAPSLKHIESHQSFDPRLAVKSLPKTPHFISKKEPEVNEVTMQ